jgi:hypothetical protein
VALIQKQKSCLVAAACPCKQKLVCDPIWQSSTRSRRGRSYQYYRQTAKRYVFHSLLF